MRSGAAWRRPVRNEEKEVPPMEGSEKSTTVDVVGSGSGEHQDRR
jgi:hypothetical protein